MSVGMLICRKCSYLYDPPGDERAQRCGCDRGDQERWEGWDFNERTTLCHCCAAEALRSGSRWSVWFCDECKGRVLALNRAAGTAVIPIGRHSLMSGVGLRGVEVTDVKTHAFVKNLHSLFGRMNDVNEWRKVKVNQNLAALGDLWDGDAELETYLDAVRSSDEPALTKDASFRGLCSFFELPEWIHP